MTAIHTTGPMGFGSQSNIQAIIGAISNAFSSCGWVKSGDSGQINIATVNVAGATNQVLGYEIWKMADALQATYPVFLKIEYGSSPTSSAVPNLWVTVGTGSNGSGGLTGQVGQRVSITVSNATVDTVDYYFSGDTNRMAFNLFGNATTSTYGTMILVVERTHNQLGQDTGDGIMLLTTSSSQYIPSSGLIPSVYSHWNSVAPPSGTGVLGNDVSAFPVRCWTPGESSPFFGALAFLSSDLPAMNPVQVVGWDGVSRNYVPFSGNYSQPSYISYGANAYFLMRFD